MNNTETLEVLTIDAKAPESFRRDLHLIFKAMDNLAMLRRKLAYHVDSNKEENDHEK